MNSVFVWLVRYKWRIIGAIPTGIATVAALLAITDHLNWLWDWLESDSVSPVQVVTQLRNCTNDELTVQARGDIIYWFPGPSARHDIGKYMLLSDSGKPSEAVKLKAGQKLKFVAQIYPAAKADFLLRRGDIDANFHVRAMNHKFADSPFFPFIQSNISHYYVPVSFGCPN